MIETEAQDQGSAMAQPQCCRDPNVMPRRRLILLPALYKLTLLHVICLFLWVYTPTSMDGLRTQARERFLSEQRFKQDAELHDTITSLLTVTKSTKAEPLFKLTEIDWCSNKNICDEINAPIPKNDNEEATASMRLIRLELDNNGVFFIDQRTFLEIFDGFGFDPYWLDMILSSTYGFFSHRKEGGAQTTYYLHTVSYTMLWSYDYHEVTTKAMLVPREHSRCPQQVFDGFIQTIAHHKELVKDARFCSFVCAIQVVRWIEGTAFENLCRIRSIEVATGHGAWQEVRHVLSPSTDELVRKSKLLGSVLTALANVSRHACIVRAILNDLTLAHPSSIRHTVVAQSSSTLSDGILVAASMLEGQTKSGELQAGYLQERGRTQQAVVR